MAVEIQLLYEGSLRCRATHGPSGEILATDAPVDNQGRGESFSPTDLVATALGSCILTTMGIAAQTHGIDMDGARVRIAKEMIADPRRRIAALPAVVNIPKPVTDKEKKILERAALTCPVHESLDPRIERPVEFIWS